MSVIADLVLRNKQKREDAANKELSQEFDELDLYIAKHQAELGAKMKLRPDSEANDKEIAGEKEKSVESFLRTQEVENYLSLFTKVQHAMVSAQAGLKQFESTKAMRLQMLALPSAQSDLLLRYQTTWERRLSAAIGEYLELRKRNQCSS